MTLFCFVRGLVGVSFALMILSGCQSVPVRRSKDLSLKISLSQAGVSATAVVFIKGEKLRAEILRPFIGPFVYLYLKGEEATLLFPTERKYYQGNFSRGMMVLPVLKNLPIKWFVSILKEEFSKDKGCVVRNKGAYCNLDGLEIFFKRRDSKRTTVVLKMGSQKLKIKIRKLSRKLLKEEIFTYDLKGYQPITSLKTLKLQDF